MLPWEFRALSSEHKAELVAVYIVEKEIDGYYKSESMKKLDANKRSMESKSGAKRPTPRHR